MSFVGTVVVCRDEGCEGLVEVRPDDGFEGSVGLTVEPLWAEDLTASVAFPGEVVPLVETFPGEVDPLVETFPGEVVPLVENFPEEVVSLVETSAGVVVPAVVTASATREWDKRGQ